MRFLSWLCRIYGLLLRAYPSEFRKSYADEMTLAFRDCGRQIVEAEGPIGLFRYSIFTGKDWLKTVFQERMSSMHMLSSSMWRWVFLFCIAVDLLLVKQRSNPTTTSAPLPFALLVMYGLLVFWATTNLDLGRQRALQIATSLGLVSGVVLTAWTTVSYLVPSALQLLIGCISFGIILASWATAGYRATRLTGTMSSGWLAGCWSGIVCALVKVTCALLILKLAATPLHGQTLGEVLTSAGQHLLESPVIGSLLGALASLPAKIPTRVQSVKAGGAA